jgi:hypothetical protein
VVDWPAAERFQLLFDCVIGLGNCAAAPVAMTPTQSATISDTISADHGLPVAPVTRRSTLFGKIRRSLLALHPVEGAFDFHHGRAIEGDLNVRHGPTSQTDQAEEKKATTAEGTSHRDSVVTTMLRHITRVVRVAFALYSIHLYGV